MNDVSFLIKTLDRPNCLSRLLESVAARYPGVPAVIVDDSPRPYAQDMLEQRFAGQPFTAHHLPADQGASAGRNHGLEHIETPYFVLLDDDHAMRPDGSVERMREAISPGDWDLVGGAYVEYDRQGRPYVHRWEGWLDRIDTFLICRRLASNGGLTPCDIVNNFFIARTDAILALGGWDADLKTVEHVDFFLRGKAQNLRVAHLLGALVDHFPRRTPNYNRYRTQTVSRSHSRLSR